MIKTELNNTNIKQIFNNFLLEYIDLPFEEKYQIYLDTKKHQNTAYWFYEPPHNIVLGNKILSNMKKNHDKYEEYITSFIKHEISHSLWTNKLNDIIELLELLKIPFHYFNLFEDARIEEKFRKITKEFFNWSYYEEIELENNSTEEILKQLTPLQIYFYFIYSENELNIKHIKKNFIDAIKKHRFYYNIKKFYLNTINCNTTEEILPILKEFYKIYNNSIDNSTNNKDKKTSISSSKDIKNLFNPVYVEDLNIKLTEEDKKNLILISTTSFSDKDKDFFDNKQTFDELSLTDIEKKEKKLKVENTLTELSKSTKDIDLFFGKRKISEKKQKKIINLSENIINLTLKKIFKLKWYKQIKENISYEIDPNRLVIDIEKIFIHKKQGNKGKRKKKKKLVLIVDTSGSMNIIYNEVLSIIYIFNRLYQYKVIDLDIILSSGYRKNEPKYLKLNLPLQSKELFKLHLIGGVEGLENCFIKNKRIIQKSDIVFVLTDGMIVDNPINKKKLNEQGIFTRAIYIYNKNFFKNISNSKKQLYKYFDEVVVHSTIEKIFEEIILNLK